MSNLTSAKPLLILWLLCAGACSLGSEQDAPCGADVLPEICDAIQDPETSDRADEIPALRGVIVERVGDRTLFKIPLAYTVGGDQMRLLDETVHKFTTEIGTLNEAMIARGVDLTSLMNLANREEFESNYLTTLDRIFDTNVDSEMEIRLGESYGKPRELWAWQRYLVPQAFVAYFSTKFSVNVGVGGGVSATILLVVQPWLVLEIDHTERRAAGRRQVLRSRRRSPRRAQRRCRHWRRRRHTPARWRGRSVRTA